MRTALRTIILAIREWLPSELFRHSEVGVWYDPSDSTTLFADSAGTTAAVLEGPVGLMLDKSKGLVLGAELAPELSLAGWSVSGADASHIASFSSGSLRYQSDTTTPTLDVFRTGMTVAGKWYQLEGNCSAWVSGAVKITEYATGPIIVGGVGRFSGRFLATGTTVSIKRNTANVDLTIDNISVRELPGNHASQSTSTKRPVLSQRYNLLTKTEDFGDAVWTKAAATITANATTAPDGTTTGVQLIEAATTAVHKLECSAAPVVTGPAYESWYVKAGTRSWCFIDIPNIATSGAWFDLTNGVVGTSQTGVTATITRDAATGWCLCTVSKTSGGFGSARIAPSTGNNVSSYAGDGTSGIYIWHPSLVPADQASLPYQRVNTSTDYDTVGFKPYLKFDGVDDALSTGSIDFSAGGKMTVVAGVRKLSDSAEGWIVNLNSTAAGSFRVVGPASAGSADYAVAAVGSLLATAGLGGAAPNTAVLVMLDDISGDSITIRKNTISTTTTTDQGTGNFANAALHIGQRSIGTLPFNGQLFSLIVRGASSTAAQITSAETYTANKTGVTL